MSKETGGEREGIRMRREGWIFHSNNGEPLYHYLPSRPCNRRLIPEVQYRLIGNRASRDIHREQQAFATSSDTKLHFREILIRRKSERDAHEERKLSRSLIIIN